MMRDFALIAALSICAGCLGPPTCDTEGRYQASRVGQRIEAPEDLDDPESYKEMTIPQPSPRERQPEAGRCLEMPPPISSGRRD